MRRVPVRRSTVRRSMRTLAGVGALAALLAAPPIARADEFVVTTQVDGGTGSLRDALAQANARGGSHRITFAPEATLLDLNTETFGDYGPTIFTITADVTIEGATELGPTLQVNGSVARARMFTIAEGASLTLRRVRVTGGHSVGSKGGGSQSGGMGGGSAGLGGAIYNRGTLVAEACTFTDNYATGGAGGESLGQGIGGGGGGAGLITDGGPAVGSNGGLGGLPNGGTAGQAFGGAGGDGGAGGGGGGAATGNAFSPPSVPGNGGFGGGGGGSGTYAGAGASLPGGGGGFGGGGGGSGYGLGGIGSGGVGGYGGGAGAKGGNQSLFASGGGGGGGAGMGGAIFNDVGSVTLTNCTFGRNGAVGGAGGVGVLGGGTGQAGSGFGGAIFSRGGSLSARFCTFNECRADQGGGAVYYLATQASGVPGLLDLGNSILANTANGATDAVLTSDGSGLTGVAVVRALVERNSGLAPLDLVTADPLLGELASNGGPVPTYLPGPGSPALDAGANFGGLQTDARGAPRTSNLLGVADADDGTDFGAVELDVNVRVETTSDAPGGVVWPGAPVTFTVRVVNDGYDIARDVEVYETPPAVLGDVVVTSSLGQVMTAGPTYVLRAGDLLPQSDVILTVSGVVGPTFATTIENVAGVELSSDQTSFADDESRLATTVQTNLGTLYLANARFGVNWKKHDGGAAADTLALGGVLDQLDFPETFEGATLHVLVNGAPLPFLATLDARGRARSARKESPRYSVSVRSDGAFDVSVSGLDLRGFVGFEESNGPDAVRVRVEVVLTPAVGDACRSAGTFEFAHRESRSRRSTGSFSFRKDRTVSGVLIPFRMSVVQTAAGDTLSCTCAMAPFEGGPLLIGETGGDEFYAELRRTEVGAAAAAFRRSGSSDTKSVFRLGSGSSYGLARVTLDNRARTVQFTTLPLAPGESDVPPVGDAALTYDLGFVLQVRSPTTLAQSFATALIRRKKATSGRWAR